MKTLLHLQIHETSQISEARRLASAVATNLGFSETDVGRIAIIVTELTGNLIKHTLRGGELIMQTYGFSQIQGIEFLVLDSSPGMRSVTDCLRDGFSTAGSPGTGLGSVMRLSDHFDIYSVYGQGTCLLSRISFNKKPAFGLQEVAGVNEFEPGGVCVPKPGQEVAGDRWAVKKTPRGAVLMVADGLGHGIEAAAASTEAVRAFLETPLSSLTDTMEVLHGRLRPTRGAAISIAEIDRNEKVVRYCGTGNVAGAVYTDGTLRSMISHNGIVGHELRKLQEFSYAWTENSLLILHSDGIGTRWTLEKYPGLPTRYPSVISSIIYRDYKRGNDDATVVVLKQSHNN